MTRQTDLNERERAFAETLLRTPPVPPRATYRLQVRAGFSLADACEIVPYLARLGISHLYLSPVWASTSGSTHGYDVVDFGRIDDAIGGRSAFDVLTDALHAHGMEVIVDMVPNHMGIAQGANPWWQDVLENGRASDYADFFDIDWLPLKFELKNQVLVPVLGDQFGNVLERGELSLRFEDGSFLVDYFGTPFPIAPPSYPVMLRSVLGAVRERYQPDDLSLLELESIVRAFERLPSNDETDAGLLTERRREQLLAKNRLTVLLETEPTLRAALEQVLERLNGIVGDPASFDELEALLDAQSWRLAFWRVAAEEINYRRFFAIDDLAAIRQENPVVFTESHRLLLSLIASGQVAGVRIDHPDGLWDPEDYLETLQRAAFLRLFESRGARGALDEPDGATLARRQEALRPLWEERPVSAPIYVVVEKILEAGEQLPEIWPVAGTVGYEFAALVTGLFVRSSSQRAFDSTYRRFVGPVPDVSDLEYEQKKRIMRVALVSEVNVLARALDRITERNRRTRDFTLNNLRYALREIIACFPVYRTYIASSDTALEATERASIDEAVDEALHRNPESDPGVFEFIRDLLQLRIPESASQDERTAVYRFVMKFQQLTSPVMAKGVEDTVFYQYDRLLSLNEVGSDPAIFGASIEAFHRDAGERAIRWPGALLASSTHDTKRSEDVRTRISALTELPAEWRDAVGRWARLNRRHTTRSSDGRAPDRNDEYHFYQTLVGIWPFDNPPVPDDSLRERIGDYMIKAVREAKIHSSWINPNEAYETAVRAFVDGVLDPETSQAFLEDVRRFMPPIIRIGAFSSLSQQLLKLTSPGVPDIYQGTELWNLSLVDPDNRRPVDYAQRSDWLEAALAIPPSSDLAAELLADLSTGRIKLFLTAVALAHRSHHSDLYARGAYEPLETRGPLREHLVAFRRTLDDQDIVVVVPRLVGQVMGGACDAPVGDLWRDTVIVLGAHGSRRYRNAFTGISVDVSNYADELVLEAASVLEHFPVALLDFHSRDEFGNDRPIDRR